MIYTPDGRVGAFQANEYKRLITTAVEKATRVATKNDLKAAISRALQEGKSIEEILRDLWEIRDGASESVESGFRAGSPTLGPPPMRIYPAAPVRSKSTFDFPDNRDVLAR